MPPTTTSDINVGPAGRPKTFVSDLGELFATYDVTVDYQTTTMTLANPATYAYHGKGTIIPLTFDRNLPLVEASIVTRRHGTIPARLHLDLGSATYAMRLALTQRAALT